ncbi:MAG: hypothetical protein ACM3OF_16270 [Gemmatimonas sp.]|jgi:hypothetical protein
MTNALQAEITELRQQLRDQHITMNAVFGSLISIMDMLCRSLEEESLIERQILARRLRATVIGSMEATARARHIREPQRGPSDQPRSPIDEVEAQEPCYRLVLAFAERLEMAGKPPPTLPSLRSILSDDAG